MFIEPHTLVPRSDTNPTSKGRKAEVQPHFASLSQEAKQKKDTSREHRAGCRWLLICHLCLSQAVNSVQNNELKHQVLCLAGKQWAPLD